MKLTKLFKGLNIDPALYPEKITSTEFRNEDKRFREPLEGMGLYTGYEATIQLVATRSRFKNTYTLVSHFQRSTHHGNAIHFKDEKKTIMQDAGRDDVIAFIQRYEEGCRAAYLSMWAQSAMANAHESLNDIYSYNTDDHVNPLAEKLCRLGTGPLANQMGADKTMAARLHRMQHKQTSRTP